MDAHRLLDKKDNLDDIFTIQEKRKLSGNLTFKFDNKIYAIEPNEANLKLKSKNITVITQLDGAMRVRYRKTELRFAHDSSRPKQQRKPPKRATHKDLTDIINRLIPDMEPFVDLSIDTLDLQESYV